MKVSFLVTYYNQEEYVKQSMESILAIDKPCDWEILVGDDGSTDGTIEVVNEYIKQYPSQIKLYIMPRIQGEKYDSVKRASANRLNILEHSTGEIFCTLDGDDYYCDTAFVKEAIDIFEQYNDVSITTFGFKYVTNGVSGREFTLPEFATGKKVNKNTFLNRFYIPAGGCVHRKCFDNERIEYIKKLGYFDDNNIVVNSLNYGEMFAVNRVIYSYRQTGQSVYTSMSELEQAILNVQGMDVDLRLVDKTLKDNILHRYSSSTILMYVWRKQLHRILGENKCKKYEEGCLTLMPSICYGMLNYSVLSKDEKKLVHNILIKTALSKPKCVVKESLKYIANGRKMYEKQ